MFREGEHSRNKPLNEGNSVDLTRSLKSHAAGVPIFGIDLGSRKIRAVAGFADANEKIEIIALTKADSNGIEKGILRHIEATAEDIRIALKDLSLFFNNRIEKVFVGISGNHLKRFAIGNSLVRKRPGQPVSVEEVDEFICQTGRQIEVPEGECIFHIYPQQFIINRKGGIRNPVGLKGKKIEAEFQVVTGQITFFQSIVNCLSRLNLKAAGFIPGYMAASEAVLNEEEKREGVALLDIGSATTHVVIFHNRQLRYSALIPFGSANITEDIKNGLLISGKEAELVKVKSGSALSDEVKGNEIATFRLKGEAKEVSLKNLARIIQARTEEILEMAMLEIKNAGLEKDLKKGIVLTGGGSQLKNIAELVKRQTGLPSRIGYPVERLAGGVDMEARNPMNATSIGLIVKGYESLKFRV